MKSSPKPTARRSPRATMMRYLRTVVALMIPMAAFGAAPQTSLRFYELNPFVQYVPPNAEVTELKVSSRLLSFAAPGQYEPLTCGIYSPDGADNVTVIATDLIGAAGVIP